MKTVNSYCNESTHADSYHVPGICRKYKYVFQNQIKIFGDTLKHWSEENDEFCWLYSIRTSSEVICLITPGICHILQWVRFWLSAHWTQMLPSSSTFHVQPIQQKFMAPLCSSGLQGREAVLTWKRQEEQQEQKCCQEARAVHGMVRAGAIPATSTAPAVAERKGWSTVDVRGAFLPPQAPAAPHQPLSWVGSSCSAKCCLGLHRALL